MCTSSMKKKIANFLRCVLLSNKDGFFFHQTFPTFFCPFCSVIAFIFSFLVYFRKSCWLEFCGVKLVGVEKLILSLKKFQVFFWQSSRFFLLPKLVCWGGFLCGWIWIGNVKILMKKCTSFSWTTWIGSLFHWTSHYFFSKFAW